MSFLYFWICRPKIHRTNKIVVKSKNTWNKIYFLFLTNSKNIVFIMLKKHAKWFFFGFMLKMVFLKKDIFMMIFFKTLPYFLSLFFPFLLLPDLSCHFFFPFLTCQGSSRVSTVLFALYLSLFFFSSISTTGWFVLLNGGRSSHKGCLSSIGKAVRPIAEREIATKQYKAWWECRRSPKAIEG